MAKKSRNANMQRFNRRALIIALSEAYRHRRAKGASLTAGVSFPPKLAPAAESVVGVFLSREGDSPCWA
ncbi:hypothetical protein MPLB_1190047 [Mesorhizobium sp. ORS 3324]|nr:hypothetical protein MPLB_1190047 [Mesorhizobium sp. ORS 3324]